MFNSRSIPLLGTVINYEVPLKDTDEAAHGDTITVLVNKESIKVRLEGIDASESKQSFGTQSKQALSEMVFGKQVTIKKTGDDRYGRTLGVVMFGNVDANA